MGRIFERFDLHSLGWYCFAIVVVSLYGGQVCPFIESLDFTSFFIELTLAISLTFVARLVLWSWTRPATGTIVVWIEVGLLMLAGLGLAVYNRLHYNFPMGSGLKVTFALIVIGYYLGIDRVLGNQKRDIQAGMTLAGSFSRPRSLITKFSQVAFLSTLLFGGIIVLVIAKDLEWLRGLSRQEMGGATLLIATEIVFVLAVLLGMSTVLIVAYSRNLKTLFAVHTNVLSEVSHGNLENKIPVFSADEFGHLARYTNTMIESLRDKSKVERLLGKVMHPDIARRLMQEENLEGQKKTVTIMMGDLRNFTGMVETRPADLVVRDLNRFFERVVAIVSHHGGILDKFLGDGFLAIFGSTAGPDEDPGAAVRAGIELLRAVEELERVMDIPLKVGIGIHRGEVILGRIGSPERLEYTAIGDAVNTAARLEASTKEVGVPMVVSDIVFELSDRAGWRDLGELSLKGKQKTMRAYGFSRSIAVA